MIVSRVCLLYLLGAVQAVSALRARTYRHGDPVKVRVNKMTSLQTLFPLSHYHVPFCEPDAHKGTKQNLGQHLTGDEIRNSPYVLNFGQDMYCEQLCVSNLGNNEKIGQGVNQATKMVQAIRKDFHANWLVDGLPAAYRKSSEEWITTKFAGGFPIGYVGKNGRSFVYNHVNLEIHYHPVHEHDGDDEDLAMSPKDEFRIVRFIVEPFSIKHHFKSWGKGDLNEIANAEETSVLPKVVNLIKPTKSCDPNSGNEHTSFHQLYEVEKVHPQRASGRVLFTYDVIWKEDMETHWGDRWAIYLSADGMRNTENHWFSTIVSLVLLATLSSMIVALLSKNLQRDFNRYNKVATDEEKEEALEEYGWKLVHGDVFRPPPRPLALCVLLGTGAQLLATFVVCLALGILGIIQPMHRGTMVIAQLVCYSFFGAVNGYITGKFYRMMGGTEWRPAAIAASFGYSGLAFFVFFINSCMANSLDSTMRVSFGVLVAILVLWLLICTPLTIVSTWVGFYRPQIDFPTNVNTTPRAIPPAPWYTSAPASMVIAGIFPFVPCFFEVYDTLCTVWLDAYDPFYAFFFFIALCALFLSTEMTVLLTYFQLVREDYTWWWRSFATGGSTAVYIFGYVVYYHAQHLQAADHLASWFLYYGYMLVACLGLACGAGFAGFLASLSFTRTIFSSVKID